LLTYKIENHYIHLLFNFFLAEFGKVDVHKNDKS